MSKQGNIQFDGVVTEASGRGIFIVTLENDHKVTCTTSGRLKQNFIKVIPGDRVQVEISPYDLTKGRISRRYKS